MLEKFVTNPRTRGYLICFISVAILSMDSFFIRHVGGVKFLTFLCYRDLFASFAFGVLLSIDSSFSSSASGMNIFKRIRSIDWRSGAAIMMVCVYSFTFAMALRYGVVAISLVIIASTPLFASIFSWIFIGESIETTTKIASLACAGAIVYVTVASVDGKDLQGAENLVVGNICAVVCAIATGAFFALLRYCVVVAQQPADVQVIMTTGFLLTALLAAAGGAGLSPITATDALYLFLQGCVSVTVGFFGLSMSTMLLTSTEVSMCMLLETILGPAIVYLGGFDRVPMPAVYGGIIIISSLAFNRYEILHQIISYLCP
jgi:drug/metabolite transporter (DMT)-like permease